jgi:hypothetical protein
MKKTIGIFLITFVLLYSLSGIALAALLYDNGPINGQTDAWTLQGYQVSDSFTLTGTSTLTGAQIGIWANSGDTPVSVDWSIGTTYNDSTYGSGTGLLTNNFQFTNGFGYNVYESTFALSGTLGAGTYWLTLQNAYPTFWWDMNGGPSQVWHNSEGLNPSGYGPSGTANPPSSSFQIYGTSSVPEPATMLLLGLGLMGLAGVGRKFKK